jgi:hypothetical protein
MDEKIGDSHHRKSITLQWIMNQKWNQREGLYHKKKKWKIPLMKREAIQDPMRRQRA